MVGLNIGGVPEHFNLPWRLAIEDGKFRDFGLNLHWADMSGGTGQMIRGLENKSIDIAVLLTEGCTKAILQGLDATIIQVYVTSPLQWGVHVPFDSNIQKMEDLKDKTYAISREGSGSHLMSYVLAHQQGFPTDNLKFNVIGDIYGGIWALEHNEAQAFLWEKYTTAPFVEQKKCRSIGDVVTPWPCFVIAVRNEVLEKHEELLDQMCKAVNQRAKEMLTEPNIIDIISWRYNLRSSHVESWLKETVWNYDGIAYPLEFNKTVNYLKMLNLITEEQGEDWREKLFK